MAQANTTPVAQNAAPSDLLEWAEQKAKRLLKSLYAGTCWVGVREKSNKIFIVAKESDAPVAEGAKPPTKFIIKAGEFGKLQAALEADAAKHGTEIGAPPGHENGAEIIVTAKRSGKRRWDEGAKAWVDNPNAGEIQYLRIRRLDRSAQEVWESKMDEQRPSRVKQAVRGI